MLMWIVSQAQVLEAMRQAEQDPDREPQQRGEQHSRAEDGEATHGY